MCWTRDDPGEHQPLWGEVNIEKDEMELMTLEDRRHPGRLLQAVPLGVMNGFPISDADVYYCYDEDMIYYYPDEARLIDPRRPYFLVYSFRTFREMVTEFT